MPQIVCGYALLQNRNLNNAFKPKKGLKMGIEVIEDQLTLVAKERMFLITFPVSPFPFVLSPCYSAVLVPLTVIRYTCSPECEYGVSLVRPFPSFEQADPHRLIRHLLCNLTNLVVLSLVPHTGQVHVF